MYMIVDLSFSENTADFMLVLDNEQIQPKVIVNIFLKFLKKLRRKNQLWMYFLDYPYLF